jgi:LPXTG-motif cell wall-anchored protein
VRSNGSYSALKNITQYEFEECFFSNTAPLEKQNVKKAKQEVFYASVFTDWNFWLLALLLVVLIAAGAGVYARKRKKTE